MKEFQKFDDVREISSHNYMAIEQIISDIKVSYIQCKLAYEYEGNNGRTNETDMLIGRGLDDIECHLSNINTLYDCMSKGIDIDI